MAVPFSNTKLRVPKGFQNILESLAREVLRSQPSDIYMFAAQHFENLLKTREDGGPDPAQHGAQMEDRFYNNKSFQKPDLDPSSPEQQEAALAIQTKYRQFHAKQVVVEKRQEKAAVTIQAGFRGYSDRKTLKEPAAEDKKDEEAAPAASEPAPAAAAPAEEEVDIDLNDPEVNEAATKIQAGFKGHKARKQVKEMKADSAKEPEAPAAPAEAAEPAAESAEQDQAATKIQAGFRGMQARKDVKARKEAVPSTEPAETTPPALETAPDTEEKPEDNVAAVEEKKEEIDIDLADPEVQQAATKIQAGFKGMKTRKELKEKGQGEEGETGNDEAEGEKPSDDKVEPSDDKVGAEEEKTE